MKVIYGIGNLKPSAKPSAVAIGVFDGVHCGHQYLIQQAVDAAKRIHGQSVVVTFYPHPVHVLRPELDIPYLISLDHRLKRIEECGVDVCVVVRFSKRFAAMSPESFVRRYLVQGLKAAEVFVGDDFRFGKDRAGGPDVFHVLGAQHGFRFHPVDRVQQGGAVISSTRIRQLILHGKLAQAQRILGRPVSLMGAVTRGDGRGRQLGFPTMNIELGNDVWPSCGVYVVEVMIGRKRYHGMANIGQRPSFKRNGAVGLEVHLFDFKRNVYGQQVVVSFLKKLRDEKTFSSQEQLIKQLQQDQVSAKRFLT